MSAHFSRRTVTRRAEKTADGPADTTHGENVAPSAMSSIRPHSEPPGTRDEGLSSLVRARSSGFLSRYAIVGVWILMTAAFSIAMPDTFARLSTFKSIFGSQQVLIFLGIALLITAVVGEFDLSIASIMGLSATSVPVLTVLHGVPLALSCVIAIIIAAACGALNAIFVVLVGVESFIVTLGSATMLLGVASWISNQTVVSGLSPSFANLSSRVVFGLPVSFYYGLALALVVAYVFTCTPTGRHMNFVGANAEVARLAGVRVERLRIGAFIVAGVIAGLGGVILVSASGGYDSSASTNYLLPTFAAVFLGTAVVRPGRFNSLGTVVAIYFLNTGVIGLALLGYTGWVENVFYGAALILAVAIATVVRRRTAAG